MNGIAMTTSKAAKILIVDDHPLVREGLALRISRRSGLEVCGEADNVEDALRLIDQQNPDLAIVDVSLKSGSGVDLIHRIKARAGHTKVLVLSMYDEALYAERVLRAGAMGYINKQEARENVLDAIEHVLAGRYYLSAEMHNRMLHHMISDKDKFRRSVVDCLSNRELEVFELIGQGLPTSQIADRLHVSIKTIETHRQRIKNKLGLRNSAELGRSAAQWVLETR
jgi:DNA-binding NarL/FixJ family response regulator